MSLGISLQMDESVAGKQAYPPLSQQEIDRLVDAAVDARQKAYAPYSKFKVGAAVLADDDRVYVGCNVENASYGATICAERVALGSAVADGRRKIKAVAVVADTKKPCPPCGVCRQVLAEFGIGMWVIMVAASDGQRRVAILGELLPEAFDSTFI